MAGAASVVLCWFAGAGCSVQSDKQKPTTPASSPAQSQQCGAVANAADPVEDGYSHPNIDARREAIYPYFEWLKESRNAEEPSKRWRTPLSGDLSEAIRFDYSGVKI